MGSVVVFMSARHAAVMSYDAFEQAILDEICGMAPVDPDDARTGSSRAAQERRAAARRKRLDRKRRAEKGVPDPRAVDAAIAAGLADVMRRNRVGETLVQTRDLSQTSVGLHAILRSAMARLVKGKGVRPRRRRPCRQRPAAPRLRALEVSHAKSHEIEKR